MKGKGLGMGAAPMNKYYLPDTPPTKVRETGKADYDTTHKARCDIQPPTKVRETEKTDYGTTHKYRQIKQPPPTKVREIEQADYDTTQKEYHGTQPPTKVRETEKADYDTTHNDYREPGAQIAKAKGTDRKVGKHEGLHRKSGGKRLTPAPPLLPPKTPNKPPIYKTTPHLP